MGARAERTHDNRRRLLHDHTLVSSSCPRPRLSIWVPLAHVNQEVIEHLIHVPTALRRRFVEGQAPFDREFLHLLARDLPLASLKYRD